MRIAAGMYKDNAILIVNKYAGKNQNNRDKHILGSWKHYKEQVISTLDDHFELDIYEPEYGFDKFQEAIYSAAGKHKDSPAVILFYGGDDTGENGLTHYLNAMDGFGYRNPEHKIAFIMGGEGKAFKYAFGYGSLSHSLELITDYRNNHARVDLAKFNDERYGFYGGHGFFGRVVGEREKTKISGVKGYVLPAIKTYLYEMFKDGERTIRFISDGKENSIRDIGMGLMVGKVRNIGGGIPLIPGAVLNDGKLHLRSFHKFPLISHGYSGQEFHIEFEDSLHYGGECKGQRSLHVTLERLAINLILDKERLIRNKALLPVADDEYQP